MQHQLTGLGFCCKGKVSLRVPHTSHPEKNIHRVLAVPQSNYMKVAFAKCLFGVNARAREGTESGTSLGESKTANMQCNKSLYFLGPRRLVASLARESAAWEASVTAGTCLVGGHLTDGVSGLQGL